MIDFIHLFLTNFQTTIYFSNNSFDYIYVYLHYSMFKSRMKLQDTILQRVTVNIIFKYIDTCKY